MTLTPCPSIEGELILQQPNHRAASLARVIGARKLRRQGQVRYFLNARQARQFTALYGAGFWAVRGGFRRDPRPLDLYGALAVCRDSRSTGFSGLTAEEPNGSLTAKDTELIHQD